MDIFLEKELRKETYSRTKSSSMAHIILIGIFAAISWKLVKENPNLYLICLLCIALNLIRFFSSMEFNRSHTFSKVINLSHDIGAIGSAICWGSIFILTYLKSGLYTQYSLSLYMIISGVSSGAVGSLSSQFKIFLAFICSILTIPGIVIIFHEVSYDQKLLGTLLIIYSFFLYTQSKQNRINLIEKIKRSTLLFDEKNKIEELFDSVPGITAFIDSSEKINITNLEWKKIYPDVVGLYDIDYQLGDLIYNFKRIQEHDFSIETELGESFNNGIFLIKMKKIKSTKGIIISLIDITESKKANLEIQRHKELVQHNARMVDLGEMAGGVAHEINNPLTIVAAKMFLLESVAKQEIIDKDKLRKHISDSNIAVDRISKIVNRMKSMSRKSEDDPFATESLESIMGVVNLMTSTKMENKNVVFINNMNCSGIDIFCRASQIEQVLINLINNSVDAIENNQDRWLKLETEDLPEKVIIKITDSGNGISEAVQSSIWNSFYTTKEKGKGTGLGLSISKQIIESHSGKIYIDSACPNTCFVIELKKNQTESA
jgi:signal transduction histidine kinase